jgi:response regulator NasT
VIVAEDEALIRMDLVELLAEAGYRVIGQAGDGQQAVDLAARLKPDVVFLDVAMPVRDGLSAAEEIASRRIAPVVMLTAFSQRGIVERAARAGALGYLVKPFTAADLVPAIEVARARWTQVQELHDQVADLRDRAAARELVDTAKEWLQRTAGLSEPEAFAALRRRAMDRRVTLAEAAAQVLDEH